MKIITSSVYKVILHAPVGSQSPGWNTVALLPLLPSPRGREILQKNYDILKKKISSYFT